MGVHEASRLCDGRSAWGALCLARRQVVGGKRAAVATQRSRVACLDLVHALPGKFDDLKAVFWQDLSPPKHLVSTFVSLREALHSMVTAPAKRLGAVHCTFSRRTGEQQ